MRLHRRLVAIALAAIQVSILTGVLLPATMRSARADARPCATPGQTPGTVGATGIVNTYFPAASSAVAGSTSITLAASPGGDAGIAIAAGDMLIVMQMQDATIDTSNSIAYGDGSTGSGTTSLGSAGLYEYVVATNAVPTTGGTLTLQGAGTGGGLLNSYVESAPTANAGQAAFQVIRVPQYTNANLGGLKALPWNGSVGGVAAIDVENNLNLNGNTTADVSGDGFRGGGRNVVTGAAGLSNTDYVTSSAVAANGAKGEGIVGTPVFTYAKGSGTATLATSGSDYPNGGMARGAPGNAGGGATDGNPTANNQNSGGGGGANAGSGGGGGNSYSSNLAVGGLGGSPLTPSATRVFMGGGGGAGSISNAGTGGAYGASGTPGGGIMLIRTGTTSSTATVSAFGGNSTTGAGINDGAAGAGGGGAGGTIVITSPNAVSGITAVVSGGAGGSARTGAAPSKAEGPGGGGGGGAILSSSAVTATVTGGANGTTTTAALAYGASAGANGTTLTITAAQIPGAASGAECGGGSGSISTVYLGPFDPSDASVDANGTAYDGSNYTGSFDGVSTVSLNNDFTAAAIPLPGATPTNSGTTPGSPIGNALTLTSAPTIDVPVEMYYNKLRAAARQVTVTVTAPSGFTVLLCHDSSGIVCGGAGGVTCGGAAEGWSSPYPSTPAATSSAVYCAQNVIGSRAVKFWVQFTAPTTGLVAFTRYDATLTATDDAPTAAQNATHVELYAAYVPLTKSEVIVSNGCTAGESPPASGVCPGGVVRYTIDYRNIMVGGGLGTEGQLTPAFLVTKPGAFIVADDGTAGSNTWGSHAMLWSTLSSGGTYASCGSGVNACGDSTANAVFRYYAGTAVDPACAVGGSATFTASADTGICDIVGGTTFQLVPSGVTAIAGAASQGTLTFAVTIQ